MLKEYRTVTEVVGPSSNVKYATFSSLLVILAIFSIISVDSELFFDSSTAHVLELFSLIIITIVIHMITIISEHNSLIFKFLFIYITYFNICF